MIPTETNPNPTTADQMPRLADSPPATLSECRNVGEVIECYRELLRTKPADPKSEEGEKHTAAESNAEAAISYAVSFYGSLQHRGYTIAACVPVRLAPFVVIGTKPADKCRWPIGEPAGFVAEQIRQQELTPEKVAGRISDSPHGR